MAPTILSRIDLLLKMYNDTLLNEDGKGELFNELKDFYETYKDEVVE